MPPSPHKESTPRPVGGASALNSLGILATKLSVKPLNVLISVLAANFLGPEDKGLAAWIVVIVSVASYTFGLGCASAFRFVLARSRLNLTQLTWTAIAMGLSNGLAGSIAIWFLVKNHLLGDLSRAISANAMAVIIWSMPFFVIEGLLTRALLGEEKYRFVNMVELASSLLYSVFLFLFVVLVPWGLLGANLSFFASRWLSVLLNIGYVFYSYNPDFRFNWQVCKECYSYGLRVWIGGITVFMNMYLDSLFVGWTMPAAAMGNYSLALTIARSLQIMPQAINVVLTNRLIGLPRTQALRETALLHRITFWLVLCTAMILASLGHVLLPVALPDYTDAPAIFLILLIGSLASASTTILSSFFASQNMPGRSSLAQLVGFLVGGSVTPLLVLSYAGVGGAVGSSLIYLIINGVMCYFFWRQSARDAVKLFAWRYSDWHWVYEQLKAAFSRLRTRRNAPDEGRGNRNSRREK